MATKAEQDIAQLEMLLRRLELEYDMFFRGVERREPTETENMLLALVRAYVGRPIQNPGLGFKYNTLVARYNSFKSVWSRKMREREDGRALGAPRGAVRPVAPPRLEPRQDQRHPAHMASNPGEFVSKDPLHEPRRMEKFFDTYRRMREESGESTAKLKAESFQKVLAEKVEKIKREQGCDAVLIRVTPDQAGRPRIVAKPFKRKEKPSGGTT